MDYEKNIDIPFGAHDSELKSWEYTIPEGMEAIIKDGKVIVREKASEDERMRKMLIDRVRSAEELTDELREWILTYLKGQKECVADSSKALVDEDERIRKELINFILYKAKGVSEEQEHSWVVYLYKQKINTEGDFGRGYDCGYEACLNSHGAEWFEKQKVRGPLTKEEEYILHRIIEHLEDETCPSEWISLLHDIYCLPYEKQKEQKPKMTPKWLYRLEFRDSSCGLWYDGYGKWCFESGIGSISGCKTKTLPMDYDARYKQDGRDWFSSCSRKEDLMHWYSLEDAKELISKGFVFTRYLATEYHEYEQQTVFIKETALYREEIDIFELFGQKPAEWSEEDEYRIRQIERIVRQVCTRELQEKIHNWLKSLRPQPREEIYQSAKHDLAIRFMNYLDENRPEGKMGLSNGECEDIDKAFKENDWSKIMRCVEKYRPSWKPSEEQMEALRSVLEHEAERVGSSKYLEKANFLYEQLEKLI